jgi:hypothetical protein
LPLPGKTDDESGGLLAHLVYWIRRREPVWVPLGQVNYRVPVKVLRTEREGAVWRTEFEPSRGWLKAKITPPRGRASIRAVREVDAGGIPRLPPPRTTRRRERAQRAAQELVEEMRHDAQDNDIRDDMRRRWPT